jgi:adenylosuccinate synthase
MLATIVIGANYGDEGKGLMTDYFCSKKSADLVVRFNGGAQAGHTVVTPESKRHVFSHFGSGTFLGIPTYLYKYFVVNPVIFRKEYETIEDLHPKVLRDYRCYITTPYDMMYNQFLEELRGNDKHGSCGLGIGATMERYERSKFEVSNYYVDEEELSLVRMYYLEKMQKILILNEDKDFFMKWRELFLDSNIMDHFIDDCNFFFDNTTIEVPQFNHAVFEGAQGLALDQNMGRFPYVTRSNTGMRNVIKCQREWKFDIDEIVYVTRSYLTRHGADPQFFEWKKNFPMSIQDNTNVENTWQGKIKYGGWNNGEYKQMMERIHLDLRSNGLTWNKNNASIALTHSDQFNSSPVRNAKYISTGPTRNDIVETQTRWNKT